MATNINLKAQVTIHNFLQVGDEKPTRRILSIKASLLPLYIDKLRKEVNTLDNPKRYLEFEYLPLLILVDFLEDEYVYQTFNDLPKETVFGNDGLPLLIILPEDDHQNAGINRLDVVNPVKVAMAQEAQA